MDSYQVLN